MRWIPGRPKEPGFYWAAYYAGHGEWGMVLIPKRREKSLVLNTRMNDARYGTNPHWRNPSLPKCLGK